MIRSVVLWKSPSLSGKKTGISCQILTFCLPLGRFLYLLTPQRNCCMTPTTCQPQMCVNLRIRALHHSVSPWKWFLGPLPAPDRVPLTFQNTSSFFSSGLHLNVTLLKEAFPDHTTQYNIGLHYYSLTQTTIHFYNTYHNFLNDIIYIKYSLLMYCQFLLLDCKFHENKDYMFHENGSVTRFAHHTTRASVLNPYLLNE